jgi:hypothetical protein
LIPLCYDLTKNLNRVVKLKIKNKKLDTLN